MKNTFLIALVAFASSLFLGAAPASATPTHDASPTMGVGVEVGSDTNLNLKLRTVAGQSVVAGVGGHLSDATSLTLHADYLFSNALLHTSQANLNWYVGVGAGAGVSAPSARHLDRTSLDTVNLRMPVGVTLAFRPAPLEFFAEGVPTVGVLPGFSTDVNVGAGVRVLF